ncbi:hypothetical protein GCM10009804_29190 [Kribbella hippodromi]|uniref:Uncharacterized protein n=1 Tax=Kribbella hippodromi TaxID=434347 RepID=A0ABP4NZI3_9ACTN
MMPEAVNTAATTTNATTAGNSADRRRTVPSSEPIGRPFVPLLGSLKLANDFGIDKNRITVGTQGGWGQRCG